MVIDVSKLDATNLTGTPASSARVIAVCRKQ